MVEDTFVKATWFNVCVYAVNAHANCGIKNEEQWKMRIHVFDIASCSYLDAICFIMSRSQWWSHYEPINMTFNYCYISFNFLRHCRPVHCGSWTMSTHFSMKNSRELLCRADFCTDLVFRFSPHISMFYSNSWCTRFCKLVREVRYGWVWLVFVFLCRVPGGRGQLSRRLEGYMVLFWKLRF